MGYLTVTVCGVCVCVLPDKSAGQVKEAKAKAKARSPATTSDTSHGRLRAPYWPQVVTKLMM